MKKLIETALPVAALAEATIKEKPKKGYPGNMHVWWNRSPICSSRALLFAAMADDPAEHEELYPDEESQNIVRNHLCQLLVDVANGKKEAEAEFLQQAITEPFAMADPFCGSGCLSMAGQGLAQEVRSGDINPLAYLLTKALIELPEKAYMHRPVNPLATSKIYKNFEALAEDIAYYGSMLADNVKKSMSSYYDESDIDKHFSWIWVRAVQCPNPVCHREIPLASSFVLSKQKGKEAWAEPCYDNGELHFSIQQGICPHEKESNKLGGHGAKFACPCCGEIATESYIKQQGINGNLSVKLMAVCLEDLEGRHYQDASKEDEQRALSIEYAQVLQEEIPLISRWFSPPAYGLNKFADLYLPRQLKLFDIFGDKLDEVCTQIEQDTDIAVAMQGYNTTEIDVPYSQIIRVYLVLAISNLANYNSTICTWDNRTGNIRAAFTRQAIPMTWTFVEGNPFSNATGNFTSLVNSIVEVIKGLRRHGSSTTNNVYLEDARELSFYKPMAVFTELPYYDNVGYLDLTYYFIVWLKRYLENTINNVFSYVLLDPKYQTMELASIAEHYGGNKEEAVYEYETGLMSFFNSIKASISKEIPSCVFYQYSSEDRDSLLNFDYSGLSRFERILQGILDSGYQITALWPVRKNIPSNKSDSERIAIVFRPLANDIKGVVSKRAFIQTIRRELPEKINLVYGQRIDNKDLLLCGVGLGLAVLGEYKSVLNADGTIINVHDAMQCIYQEVLQILDTFNNNEPLNNIEGKDYYAGKL